MLRGEIGSGAMATRIGVALTTSGLILASYSCPALSQDVPSPTPPNCLLGGAFETSSGWACKYVQTMVEVDTTVNPKSLLELPTQIVVEAFQAIPTLGAYVAKNAYVRESERRYRTRLSPPLQFSTYVMCDNPVRELSVNGAIPRLTSWIEVRPDHGIYRWALNKRGVGGGNTWYKAQVFWKAVHPEYLWRAQDEDHDCRSTARSWGRAPSKP